MFNFIKSLFKSKSNKIKKEYLTLDYFKNQDLSVYGYIQSSYTLVQVKRLISRSNELLTSYHKFKKKFDKLKENGFRIEFAASCHDEPYFEIDINVPDKCIALVAPVEFYNEDGFEASLKNYIKRLEEIEETFYL